MITRICAMCHKHFDVDPDTHREFPGLCDGCYAENAEKLDAFANTMAKIKPSESFFIPVTEKYPHPWETYKNELERPRWSDWTMTVVPVSKGDSYLEGWYVEHADGARIHCLARKGEPLELSGVQEVQPSARRARRLR